MSEQLSQERSGHVQLPSRLRIRQRLGHVSTSKTFKRELVADLATELGGHKLPGDDLIKYLSSKVVHFSETNGMSPHSMDKLQTPRILKQLVSNRDQYLVLARQHEQQLQDRMAAPSPEATTYPQETVVDARPGGMEIETQIDADTWESRAQLG